MQWFDILPGWLKSLVWFITGGLTAPVILAAYLKRRERRRGEAMGSHLSVKDGVETDWTRLAAATVRSWTGTPLRLQSVTILWPPTKGKLYLKPLDGMYEVTYPLAARRRHVIVPEIIVATDKTSTFSLRCEVTPFMLHLPRFLSRLRIRLDFETVDAQRRPVRFTMRSAYVDWSMPPQQ